MAGRVAKRLPHPGVLPTGERDPSMVARVVNRLLEGKMNVVGEVLLVAGTTETWVYSPLIGPQSFFVWQFLDPPPGATELEVLPPNLSWGIWLKERGTRKALIGHTAPLTDRWLEYMVIS